MNDEFLYRLRVQPPPAFAARLKARLAIEAAVAAAKRRMLRLAVFSGVFVGAVAIAFVVPSLRAGIAAWVDQLDGKHEIESPAQRRHVDAPTQDSKLVSSAPARPSIPGQASLQAPAPAASNDVSAGGPAGDQTAARSRTQVAQPLLTINVTMVQVPPALLDDVFESFRKAYGYQIRKREAADADPVCTRWVAPDAVVTFGAMSDSSRTSCSEMGARFLEVPLGYEAYMAIVNRDNTWADAITAEELRAATDRMHFDPLLTWNQVRPSWPSLPIALFGVDSTERSSSAPFVPSRQMRSLPIRIKRDDAGVPQAVEATYGGLGFMSVATYMSQARAMPMDVNVLAIVNAQGTAVLPSQRTLQDGSYDTLSRPLLLYLNVDRLALWWVARFGTHAVEVASQRVGEHGLTALDKAGVDMAVRKIRAASETR